MFSTLKRILGTITIQEKDVSIHIEGIAGHFIAADIKKLWKTSKINEHMFTMVTGSKIVLSKFFALEFVYILETLITGKKVSQQTVRAAKSIIEEMHTSTWLSNLREDYPNPLNASRLRDLHLTPLSYQLDFFNEYQYAVTRLGLKGFMLAAPPGAGKTFTSVALAEQLEVDKVIIVCLKANVNDPWIKSLSSFFKTPRKFWSSDTAALPTKDHQYYICHYDYLNKMLAHMDLFVGQRVMIILDECHNLNDPNSARTQSFVKICQQTQAEHILWMSGTPIKAMGTEVIPLLSTIDPAFTPAVADRFKKIFGLSSARALDIVAHRLGKISYRIPKSEVVPGTPIVEEIKVKVPNAERFTLDAIRAEMVAFMDERMLFYKKNMSEHQKLYDECMDIHERTLRTEAQRNQFITYKRTVAELRKHYDLRYYAAEMKFCNQYEIAHIIPTLPKAIVSDFKDVRSIIKYVQLKVRGECLGRVLGRRRIECHVAMVEHCTLPEIVEGALKKTLIFTSFVEVVQKVKAYMLKEGFSPLEVYGETNKDLKSILEAYAKDPLKDPLVATYNSLSTGVPVLAANTLVMLNAPFRPHEEEQAIARSHRLGQTEQVYVYKVFLDTGDQPNISTRSKEIMEWAQSQIDAIMGTTTTVSIEAFEHPEWEQMITQTDEAIPTIHHALPPSAKW